MQKSPNRLNTELLEFAYDYKWLIIAGLVLFIPNLFLFYFYPAGTNSCVNGALCLSSTTPWGIFTSVFIYASPLNVLVFIEFLFLFAAVNYNIPRETKRTRAKISAAVMYISAFVANATWLLLSPTNTSEDPSVVIFSTIGILLGVVLINLIINPHFKFRTKNLPREQHVTNYYYVNFVTFVGLMILIALYRIGFLAMLIPGVNSEVHAVAFFIGFIVVATAGLVRRLLGIRPNPNLALRRKKERSNGLEILLLIAMLIAMFILILSFINSVILA